MEVERGADADQQRRREARAHPQHPLLLLGLSGADPHDRGARRVDRGDHALLLLGAQRAERRREAARDLQAGKALAQTPFEQLERLRRATAVEVHRRAGARGALAEAGHEVGAVDAGGAGVAERVQRPHQGLTVRHRERGPEHGRARLRILAGGHDQVDRSGRHVSAPARGDHRLHPIDHLLVVGDRQGDVEYLCARRRGGNGRGGWGGGGRRGDCVKIPALVEIDPDFWLGRRVLVTGHTGFKGAWLSLWLQSSGR